MSESTEEVDVDLSPDDDATLDEMESETDAPDAPPEMTSRPDEPDEPEQSPAEAVDEEVKKRLSHAEGDTHTERAQNALSATIEDLKDGSKQLQQLKQQKQEAENRIERLEMTRERVMDQPADCTIMQTLAGGVSLEVPPTEIEFEEADSGEAMAVNANDHYDREDLVEEIDETIEALEENVDSTEGQIDAIEESLQKTQAAAQELEKSSGYMEALGE